DAAGLNGEGRERVGVHDLRHSFVAVALAAGLTLPEAAAPARHGNPRVTAAVYAGLTDAARAGLGAKLASAFGGRQRRLYADRRGEWGAASSLEESVLKRWVVRPMESLSGGGVVSAF